MVIKSHKFFSSFYTIKGQKIENNLLIKGAVNHNKVDLILQSDIIIIMFNLLGIFFNYCLVGFHRRLNVERSYLAILVIGSAVEGYSEKKRKVQKIFLSFYFLLVSSVLFTTSTLVKPSIDGHLFKGQIFFTINKSSSFCYFPSIFTVR